LFKRPSCYLDPGDSELELPDDSEIPPELAEVILDTEV